MDSSFPERLRPALPFLGVWFAAGFAIAAWNPRPRLIITVALSISLGILLLGPYAAAALYTLRTQRLWRDHLRWPLCLLLSCSSVLLFDFLFHWSTPQLVLAGLSALVGTIVGHDATLAVLELKERSRLDPWMVLLFPLLVGLSVLAGYSSFGFGSGSYQFLSALLRQS